jgi:hypothetical protein
MTHTDYNDESTLAELMAQTPVYRELPFTTGDFLIIVHYKLIAHYRQALKRQFSENPDMGLLRDDADRRRALHEELLFQLNKVLALSSLSEAQQQQLLSFKMMHEHLLEDVSQRKTNQHPKPDIMQNLSEPGHLAALREEINQIPTDQPASLLEKIKAISDAFAGRDFKIARHLHELQATLFTGEEKHADNFKDIRGKLLYLLQEIEKL